MRVSWKCGGCLISVIILLAGCGKPTVPSGEVKGTVSMDGKPLPEVSVSFIPDPVEGSSKPPAEAITDANGHYELIYYIPNDRDLSSPYMGKGAPLGWHTVLLGDYKMTNEMLPPPGRIPRKYTDESTSSLRFEVKEGEQTIDLVLEK